MAKARRRTARVDGTPLARAQLVRTLGLLKGAAGPNAGARRRALARGFTLLELMVVVILVSILSILAVPAMRRMRDDKAAFDYARQIQQLVHRARVRAQGTGGAHLVTYEQGSDMRGRVLLFEARDGSPPPSGPNYASSCKLAAQWDEVASFVPGVVTGTRARIVEGVDLNTEGINVDADIRAVARLAGAATPAAAMCITPGGVTYVAAGGSVTDAILEMQRQTPFTELLEVRVSRFDGGLPIGLTRRVLAVGSASPRMRSE
jgi:prepilin-type N-terminal cleavage/methylation domain-containing protein